MASCPPCASGARSSTYGDLLEQTGELAAGQEAPLDELVRLAAAAAGQDELLTQIALEEPLGVRGPQATPERGQRVADRAVAEQTARSRLTRQPGDERPQ
jgi:hypothetical protein